MKFTIFDNNKIIVALKKIEKNKINFLVVLSKKNKKISGTITESDIRRYILKGGSYNDVLTECSNKKYIFGFENDSNESLLRKFDQNIKFLPILNKKFYLIKVISREDLNFVNPKSIEFNSRCPGRISFAGGGSDITSFFEKNIGAVINSSITLYTYSSLKLRNDKIIIIKLVDKNVFLRTEIDNLSKKKTDPKFELIINTIKVINPEDGFELSIRSEIPIGSGLGGSSSLINSILGCFNLALNKHWTKKDIAELSFLIERIKSGINGGWQDQYATVFGGFNFIEFDKQNKINSLKISQDVIFQLEKSLILCNLNTSHNSSIILEDQIKNSKENKYKEIINLNKNTAYKMKDCLMNFKIDEFSNLLRDTWEIKKRLSKKISSKKINEFYLKAVSHGARSGKILGAGGGGYFLFCIDENKYKKFINFIKTKKMNLTNIRFDKNGLVSWIKEF